MKTRWLIAFLFLLSAFASLREVQSQQPFTYRDQAFLAAAAPRPAAGGGGNGLLTGLLAYWRCEDADNADRVDATGNGHTMVHHGNLLKTALSAKHNFGADFTPSLYMDNSESAFRRTASWTLSMWVNTSVSVDSAVPACQFGSGHNWFIYGVGSNFEFGMRRADDSGSVLAVSTVTFSTGAYHHIAVGWDSVAQQIWIQVDNEPRTGGAIVSYTDTPRTEADAFTINGFTGGGSGITSTLNVGGIDEIGYWTRSLSTNDVTKLQTKFFDDFD